MKTQTLTLPSYWAPFLINGDASGMTAEELTMVDAAAKREGFNPYRTLTIVEDSERFTWAYRLYCPEADCDGGEVADYVFPVEEAAA